MTEERGVVKYEARDGQQVTLSFETIKRYLVQGHSEMVTQQELMFFMGICKSKGLNPFNKDCYLIKYSQNEGAAIITAVDYFRKRAKAQRDCHGWQKGIILERDGKIVYSKGLMLEDDILLGGWFKAQPEGWSEPFELEVNLKGYIKKKRDGSITKFWAKENQPTQIAKVAESQGLRTLWPDEFQQLYTPEEMGQPEVFSQAEAIITDKTPEEALTDKIKPNYAAQDLKAKLDAGDKQVEGYSPMKDEEPDPSPIEQGEPQGILPDGGDTIEWFTASRCTSLEKATLMLKVYKEIEPTVIEMAKSDKQPELASLGRKLIAKEKKLIDYLADIEAKKQAIAEEERPPEEDESIPPFEQEIGPDKYDANGRFAYISKMRKYKEKDSDKYAKVLMDNSTEEKPLNDMNAVEPGDEAAILGFMAEEFGK